MNPSLTTPVEALRRERAIASHAWAAAEAAARAGQLTSTVDPTDWHASAEAARIMAAAHATALSVAHAAAAAALALLRTG